MAINYLNNIDLNKNQLLQGVIENQPNDAAAGASPATGQIYYNTTDNVLKQYNGSAWVSIAGDITGIDDGTYITINDPNGPIPEINHNETTRTDTSSSASPGYGATFTAVDSVTSNATGHITALNLKTVTMPSAEAYAFNVTGDSGTPETINSGNTLDIAGGTNINTIVGLAADTVTVNLDDSITLTGSLTVDGIGTFNDDVSFDANVSITGDLDMNTAKIIDLGTPTSATDAATKGYVDQAVTGALSYQGGYNASTNSPDLTTSPNSIKKGWTYTVTADGTFFGEQLRVGDVLIAEQDNPSALANWTTVQNNIDLADLTTVGIGNVNAGTGISVAYSNGTATVTNTETNADNSYAVTITDTATITHSLGTKDVMIQLYDVTTNETVYADVERGSTTQATITFAATPTNSVRVLVQKIG
jgi:hypothetical protein